MLLHYQGKDISGLRCDYRHRDICKLPLVEVAGRVELVVLVVLVMARGLVGILQDDCSLARLLVAALTHVFLHCVF